MPEAKKKQSQPKKKKVYRALVGGNLADGSRFEAGQVLDCSAKELAELKKLNAVAEEK